MKMIQLIQRRYMSVLAASAAIAMLFLATHSAKADSIPLNGGTLTYTMTTYNGGQCGAGGQTYTVYYFTVDSYTSSTNVVTTWDSSGGNYLVINGGGSCPGLTPGPDPASTQFDGSGFYIIFYPEDGYGSAAYN